MARKTTQPDIIQELDLIPVMNTVMILIPMLLLMVAFAEPGVINISSPRNAQSTTPENEEPQEPEQVPKLVIFVSNDGFRLGNMNPATPVDQWQTYANPIEGCPGGATAATGPVAPHDLAQAPATICLRDGVDPGSALVNRLDYAGLYNQVVSVRLNPAWFDAFNEEGNDVVSILADPEVPYEAVVKTMDSVRFFVNPTEAEIAPPTAAASLATYLLGGGTGRATLEQLENAKYVDGPAEGTMDFVDLFPDPVLLLPRPGAAS